MLKEELFSLFFLFLLSALLFAIARKRGYFCPLQSHASLQLRFLQVLKAFGTYLGTSFIAIQLASFLIKAFFAKPSILVLGWMQFAISLFSGICLLIFCSLQDLSQMRRMWKEEKGSSVLYDMGIGVVSWIIAFPFVAFLSQLSDLFLFYFFGTESYEQEAVRFLKMMMSTPSLIALATIMIIGIAPVFEELLFRGFLQSWAREKMGKKAAILTSSLFFAIFHLSVQQGYGNISLFISLFFLALFLGFLYERQGSLFAPIALHMTFNGVSALRILLFEP